MLSYEETLFAIKKVLENPKRAHLLYRLPELYSSIDKYYKGFNLTQKEWDTLGSIYTRIALENSPLKDKVTPAILKEKNIVGNMKNYPEISKIIAISDTTYTSEIDLSILGMKENADTPSKVTIEWGVEVDARSWGIKEMHPYLVTKELSIPYNEWGDVEDTEKTMTLSLGTVDGKDEYLVSEFNPVLYPISLDIEVSKNAAGEYEVKSFEILWQR